MHTKPFVYPPPYWEKGACDDGRRQAECRSDAALLLLQIVDGKWPQLGPLPRSADGRAVCGTRGIRPPATSNIPSFRIQRRYDRGRWLPHLTSEHSERNRCTPR